MQRRSHFLEIRLWLSRLSPRPAVRGVRNWLWVQADPALAQKLLNVGFRRSRVAPGWHYHVGLRWRDGEHPKRDRYYTPPKRRGVPGSLGFGWTEVMNTHANGFRARFRDWQRELLVVDWEVRDRRIAVALSEVLIARLERWQIERFTLKGWRIAPPLPPDLTARTQRDVDDEALERAMTDRVAVVQESLRRPTREQRRRALARELCDAVHDPERSLTDRVGVELRYLGGCAGDDLPATERMLLGMLACPEAYTPSGMPRSIEELEALTGPTPSL